jgi:hypothetical protein
MNVSCSLRSKLLRFYNCAYPVRNPENSIFTTLPSKNPFFAGGCCVPLTLSSSLPDFANDFFYPYYIAGNWSQSTLTSTYNGR